MPKYKNERSLYRNYIIIISVLSLMFKEGPGRVSKFEFHHLMMAAMSQINCVHLKVLPNNRVVDIGRFQKISIPYHGRLLGFPKGRGGSRLWNSEGMGGYLRLDIRRHWWISQVGFLE